MIKLQSSRHLVAFVIAVTLLLGTTAAYAQFPGNAYGFENFRAREWRAYASYDEMTEALQIPPKVLKALSTRDLIASCLDYPLLMEVFLTDSLQYNIEAQRERFNGLRELMSRPGAADELARYYAGVDLDRLVETQGTDATELARKGKRAFQVGFLELLLSRREILEQASENSISRVAVAAPWQHRGSVPASSSGCVRR